VIHGDVAMDSSHDLAPEEDKVQTRTWLRRLPLTWCAVFAVALIDIVWAVAGGWTLLGRERLILVALGSGSLLPLLAFARYRTDIRVRSTLLATLLLLAFSIAASVLSYLVVSVGPPLVDDAFARWDRAIGFDWFVAAFWVNDHPLIKDTFRVAYHSGLFQIGFVVLFLGFTARVKQLDEFVELYVTGLLLAIAISLFFPAAGPWMNAPTPMPFDASVLSHFLPLRSGSPRAIDLDHAQGLISMPSVHAMIAVFLCYTMRGSGRLFLPFLVINTLMLASTPTEGGHYLVDVLGGALCAAALISIRRRLE